MQNQNLTSALVTRSDGTFIGVLLRGDAERALASSAASETGLAQPPGRS